MAGVRRARLLVLMGSGETSPTMVTVHRDAVHRLGGGAGGAGVSAVLLDTPYGFQENVADISARAQAYFSRSVGIEVDVAPGLRYLDGSAHAVHGLAQVQGADWLFSGPGSPTYALSVWGTGPIGEALRGRVAAGGHGATVFASAAACTLGAFAVPVYEVYKVGAAPHWVEGLDVLAELGLRVALIPHYDNTEGGTHDTRYCYLGERRLAVMEAQLPADCAVLGLDEHTAAVVDPAADEVRIHGRGVLTVRRDGVSVVLPSGTELSLTELRALVSGRSTRPATGGATRVSPSAGPADEVPTLTDVVRGSQRAFEDAWNAGSVPGMVRAILDLDTAIAQWSADTEEDEGTPQARAVLRSLVVRLGDAVRIGGADRSAALAPVIEPLLRLREQCRTEGAFAFADAVRTALAQGGVEVRDEATTATWQIREPDGRARMRKVPAPGGTTREGPLPSSP
ncbi:hypothetical protein OG216_47365 (plasmid) [Streptomycetaceae bacterium NBC_01309]